MKKYIILFCALLFTLCVSAQNVNTLRAIIIANTQDEKIGEAAKISMNNFEGLLYEIQYTLGCEIDVKKYHGAECSRDGLDKALSTFVCDTNDIVIFCYLGHGIRSLEDTSMFPQMCLGERSQGRFMPLESVKNKLAKKGARLTVVIGDCCNTYSENVKSKDIESASSYLSGASLSLIDELFGKSTGVITMCASTKGTYGWCNNRTGMYFNNALIEAIDNVQVNTIIPGNPWRSMMNTVQMMFRDRTFSDKDDPAHNVYKMMPQYRIEPRRVSPTPIIIPKNTTLQKLVIGLIQSNGSYYGKMGQVEKIISDWFSKDAKVQVVGRNGVPFGERDDVDRYFRKLLNSPNLVNIIIRNEKKDPAGKIIYMEVHEIYKDE